MKTKTLILLASILASDSFAQGTFRNLNFEETTLPYSSNVVGGVSATEAFPGWTVYYGSAPQTEVGYNVNRAWPSIMLWSRDYWGIPAFPVHFGLFSAVPFPSEVETVSLAQVGNIPDGVNALTFQTYGLFNANSLEVFFGGNRVPLEFISGPSMLRHDWRADLSGLAGQSGELRITANLQPNAPGVTALDNLQFVAIPEPRVWVLFLAGTALLLAARTCSRKR